MNKKLKILHLEDLSTDAEIVARVFKKADMPVEIRHVTNKADFIIALQEFPCDIILSDHSLPSLNSHEALILIKQMGIETPFLLVTATVSEEYAVAIIKEGAADYILKDRLQRLPNAVISAIDKYHLSLQKKAADRILRSSEKKYKLLFESNPMPMWMISMKTLNIIAVNDAALKHYGYSRDEFLRLNAKNIRPEEDVDKYLAHLRNDNGSHRTGTWRHKKKDGTLIMVEVIANNIMYEGSPARLILANDVTDKMRAEAALAEERRLQEKLLSETSIQVQEKEREEIGKELHDNINQILATSKLYLDHGIKKDRLHSESLEKSRENISLAIEEIRKLSRTLVAPALSDRSLVQAIGNLIKEIQFVASIQISLNAEHYQEAAFDKNLKLTLYRIVQEQLNNIIKHSGAKTATIELTRSAASISLSITDDGMGFDLIKKTEGIGLRNIKNRINYYDGTVQIVSSPGNGCTLLVNTPVSQSW